MLGRPRVRPTSWRASCRSCPPAARASSSRDAGVVLMAGALVCAVGVLDDIFDIDALTKFGGQVLAAGLLVALRGALLLLPGRRRHPVRPRPRPGRPADRGRGDRRPSTRSTSSTASTDWRPGVVGIGAAAFFVFCYVLSAQNNLTLATTGALLSAMLGRGLRRVPAAQLPPGTALHGRLRLDADRARALGQRADPDRPVLRHRDAGGNSLFVDRAAGPAPGLPADGADRRPGACRRTPHARGPLAVRAGQAAPAPPSAGDRALPAAGGLHHVDVGRDSSPAVRSW